MQAQSRQLNRSENALVNAATPLLQLAMKLNARTIAPSTELRRNMDAMLKQFEERASQRGYSERQLSEVKFALVAFIDQEVLRSLPLASPQRQEWELYPLQLQYFQEALAGEKFFTRLEALIKHGESEADVVEIYYLSLLLGFRGKYVGFLEDQLPGELSKVEEYLRRAGRMRAPMLSPHWQVNDQPAPPAQQAELPAWVKWGAITSIGIVALAYLLLNSWLTLSVNGFKESLLK
ncbi:MAG: type IVB secretion system protein IcmH/DotU [Acidobacteriota bacterium]